MKLITIFFLGILAGSVLGSTQFGGVTFDDSVLPHQSEILSHDLKYLYENPVLEVDEDFQNTCELEKVDGKHLHNWVINRARYILGEDYELGRKNMAIGLVRSLFFRFPKTPLPKKFSPSLENISLNSQLSTPNNDLFRMMKNVGGGLYLAGKASKILLGLKLDKKVFATSPRVGILQIGEGLFSENFLVNKSDEVAESNSINRLGTLFHEARHSDGTGAAAGFDHTECPESHKLAGLAVCDEATNGPYTVGALSMRQMLKNCLSCNSEEKSTLEAYIVDSFGRALDHEAMLMRKAILRLIRKYNDTALINKKILERSPERKDEILAENASVEKKIKELEQKLSTLSYEVKASSKKEDATPEGKFTTLSVTESAQLMEESL